jgi:hypothetical protein
MGRRVESLRTVEWSTPSGVDGTRSHSAPVMRNEGRRSMGYEKTTERVERDPRDVHDETWTETKVTDRGTKDEGGKEAMGAGAGALGGAAVGMAVGGPPGAVVGGAIGAAGGAMAGESAEGGEEAGAGAGGVAGGLAGAVVGGAVAGPPGAVVGGAVGAAGGAGVGDKTEEEAEGRDTTIRRTETTDRSNY